MGNFFKGWRRKIGCVALVMACVVMGVWIRSLSVYDALCLPRGSDRSVVLISAKSCAYVKIMHQIGLRHVFHWNIGQRYSARDDTAYLGKDVIWERGLLGFLISDSKSDRDKWWTRSILIPYWSIAMPLTLLSAYLILWPCRKGRETINSATEKL